MNEYRIEPAKITHPFQLMAAWFVMLLALDSIFLTAASKLEHPWWASGFLVIMSAFLALLVMVAVFSMLTKYRPHLQGPKEYAEWLKDKRRFEGSVTKRFVSGRKVTAIKSIVTQRGTSAEIFQQIATHSVSISYLPGHEELLAVLRRLGFRASVYTGPEERPLSDLQLDEPKNHEAIWLGYRVPARVAVLAIKAAAEIWPHLKYVYVSEEGYAPDRIHDEIFLGGATSTARDYGLKPWTTAELQALSEKSSQEEFDSIIKQKY